MNLIESPDGLARCAWGATDALRAYHDDEWGRPVEEEAALLERLCLEGFQAGLSWLTILRKRDAFRAGFAAFEPDRLAGFGDGDVTRLLGDVGIVRHRGKVQAAIQNARATLELAASGGSLAGLLWSFEPTPPPEAPVALVEVPSSTGPALALSKELRRRGFRFVGPTTVYAAMQAIGIVDDHLLGCHARQSVEAARAEFVRPEPLRVPGERGSPGSPSSG
ncbi:MAG: DNA-3-methyladenine glycosylase I [Acidimicrobiia bacterium]